MSLRLNIERTCRNKKQFDTWKEADRNLRNLMRFEDDKETLHIYTCNYCHKFHIGHGYKVGRKKHV